ncbi:hypothetical protein RXV95_05240 [Novosphingobium sp. ZN18A2]|uniref:hypothetical protein n=1 Tax=Novosphingobium sp. ZN18A2 TaxID=3079861 RepID=UPI0030D2C69B
MAAEPVIIAAAALAGLLIAAAAFLKAWTGWLQLKARELDLHRPHAEGGAPAGMARIEIADLKERIRKLEAIASGVDL